MQIITIENMLKISPGTPRERMLTFIPHLQKYLPQYGIDTPIEIASFLSQVLHESGGFKWMREIWGPTKQQLRYERDFKRPWNMHDERNKLAFVLGNSEKGDGRLFAGRGPIQMTGRNNYKRLSLEMFGDDRLLRNPELIASPEYGIQAACIYWKWRNMDAIDDDLSIKEETKRVNGGYNGLEDRQKYFERALLVFGIVN